MLKFDRQQKIDSVNGALALRPQIEKIVDEFTAQGYDAVYFLGIGGTWASALQVEAYMKGKSSLPVFVENAAEYVTNGNRRITARTLIVFSSVTGSTQEMVDGIAKAKAVGARVFGFIDREDAPLVAQCDWCISYPANEQLKFFMLANAMMHRNGEFPDYDRYNAEMEAHLAKGLADIEEQADDWAAAFSAQKYREHKVNPDKPHYFVGAGTQWGATYSYAMCYWMEQMWIRTCAVTAGEFFHGLLEIIDAETPVTLFIGEDEQRPLAVRVANFLPKVCRNYTIIDSAAYDIPGISQEFRGSISHLILRAVNNRVDVHMEKELCHPLDIRRYYRQFPY